MGVERESQGEGAGQGQQEGRGNNGRQRCVQLAVPKVLDGMVE